MQDMKMEDVKMTDQVAGHKNAGVELLLYIAVSYTHLTLPTIYSV